MHVLQLCSLQTTHEQMTQMLTHMSDSKPVIFHTSACFQSDNKPPSLFSQRSCKFCAATLACQPMLYYMDERLATAYCRRLRCFCHHCCSSIVSNWSRSHWQKPTFPTPVAMHPHIVSVTDSGMYTAQRICMYHLRVEGSGRYHNCISYNLSQYRSLNEAGA